MIDSKAIYAIFKSIIADKAKAEHNPSLSSLESMKAYQQATKATGRASFGSDLMGGRHFDAIDYV